MSTILKDMQKMLIGDGCSHMVLASALAAGFMFSGTAAQAQSGGRPAAGSDVEIEEIVVTAQKRVERLQDVPLAVNVATGDQLKNAAVQNMDALGTLVPGLNISKPTFGAFVPSIRGISTALNTSENPTALYVDGVLIADQRDGFRDLTDVTQITVLKGPQGTLFGRNATAGVIQITTRAPSFTTSGMASLSYGSYETLRATSYITGPVTENIAASMTASYARQGKGWGKNIPSGTPTGKMIRDVSFRGKLLIEPSADTKITIIGDYTDKEDTGAPTRQLPGTTYSNRGVAGTVGTFVGLRPPLTPGTIPISVIPVCSLTSRYDGCSSVNTYNRYHGGGVSAQIDHNFDFAKLVSITSFRQARGEFKFDALAAAGPMLATSENNLPTRTFTHELQLISPSGGRLQWTAGVFFMDGRLGVEPFRSDIVPGSVIAPVFSAFTSVISNGIEKFNSVAPFAQIDYKLGDATTLTLGGRFTHERRTINGSFKVVFAGVPGGLAVNFPVTPQNTITADEPTWRIALNHKLSPNTMLYASYNRGFKSGGYNVASPNAAPFLPEKLDDWEAGLKTELFDRALTFNVNGFYYKYKNMQVFYFPGGLQTARATIGNAASSTLYGVDVDFSVRPTPEFTLNGGFEILHAEFGNYPNAPVNTIASPAAGGGIIQVLRQAKGSRIPLAQNFSGTLSANYKRNLGGVNINLNTTATYNGNYFLDVDFAKQKSYVMLNGSVTLSDPSDKISLRLAVANALDEGYLVRVITASNYANAIYGPPRTYTATASFKF